MENNIYRSKDLAEVAALILKRQTILRIERQPDNICWFVFDDKRTCEEISAKFYLGELLVNALEYHESLTRLKKIIFSNT